MCVADVLVARVVRQLQLSVRVECCRLAHIFGVILLCDWLLSRLFLFFYFVLCLFSLLLLFLLLLLSLQDYRFSFSLSRYGNSISFLFSVLFCRCMCISFLFSALRSSASCHFSLWNDIADNRLPPSLSSSSELRFCPFWLLPSLLWSLLEV